MVNLATGLGSYAEASRDVYVNVENVEGSAFADRITGDANINRLTGGAGNDDLDGAAGNDYLLGNAGNDTLIGGLGADVFVFEKGLATTPSAISGPVLAEPTARGSRALASMTSLTFWPMPLILWRVS